MKDPTKVVDVIVVGGGPAGLSGALLLGRCRRSVLVFDEGRPRNEKSPLVHCYLGLRESSPAALLRSGRSELLKYPGVSFFHQSVASVSREENTFRVILCSGREFRSRSLLLATGMIDRLPVIPGIGDFYGTSIHLCPYCDGWESSDKVIGVFGSGNEAAELALEMLIWSERVTLFINGEMPVESLCERLANRGITTETSPVTRFTGSNGMLEGVCLENGEEVRCDRLFLVASQVQHDGFIEQLGCDLTAERKADCDSGGATDVPGLFIAGNAAKGLQLAMVAAAEGILAAHGINSWLLDIDQRTADPETF